MTLHTYNPPSMSPPSINFLHLTVSEIWPGQDFIGQGHYSKVKSRSGPIIMKGLRLKSKPGLKLKSSLKVKTSVSAKFCLKIVFTKGDSAETFVLDLSLGLSLNFHISTVVFDCHVTLFIYIKMY